MYSVTEDYISQANERSMRNANRVRIVFGIVDPDAVGYSAPVDNGHLPYSSVEQFDSGIGVNATYQTLEHNRFILNGVNPLPKTSNTLFQGYVGDEISDANGEWLVNPTVTIEFSGYIDFAGLTFTFDEPFGEFPEDFRIKAYTDEVLVVNTLTHPTESFFIDESNGTNINKLEFIFEKSKIPYRRARILEVAYGLVRRIEDDILTSVEFHSECDVISTKLPTYSVTFKFLDVNQEYDPESPSELWNYLESGQTVSTTIGYELDNGLVEWIPVASSFTTGEVNIDKSGSLQSVEIKSVGLLNLLTNTYYFGVYRETPISLYDLAIELLTSIEYEQTVVLDDTLNDIYTVAPLPVIPINECLQLIANAGLCVLSTSREGSISIEKAPTSYEDFNMDFAKMKDYPVTKKYPQLRNLISGYSTYTPETESSELAALDIVAAVAKDVEITYDMSYNQSYSASGTLVVNGTPEYYAGKVILNVSGTGTLTINGYVIIKNFVNMTQVYNNSGDDCEISNDLIVSQTHAQSYIDWIALNLNRRNEYSTINRGYPELDITDNILFQGNFNENIPTTILSNKLKYNGSLSGETKLLIGSGD